MQQSESEGPVEIALVGDLTDNEGELTDKLLSIEPGGKCTMFIDSPGGSPYCAVSLMTLILLRGWRVTGIVTGECSSAVSGRLPPARDGWYPYSVLLFHPMKWQSEEHVGLAEAAEWARHFGTLEKDMDTLLADLFGLPHAEMEKWITPGRYVSGREMAAANLAEMIDLRKIKNAHSNGSAANGLALENGVVGTCEGNCRHRPWLRREWQSVQWRKWDSRRAPPTQLALFETNRLGLQAVVCFLQLAGTLSVQPAPSRVALLAAIAFMAFCAGFGEFARCLSSLRIILFLHRIAECLLSRACDCMARACAK